MASQSILTGIRRLWEYMTVPSYDKLPFDIEEEHDPVGEFIERQSRGEVPPEVVEDENVLPKKRPGSKAAKSRQPDASDSSPPPEEIAVADSDASVNEPESEAQLQAKDDAPAEIESEVPQDVVVGDEESENNVRSAVADTSPEETENEVSQMNVEEEHQEEEQTESEQREEQKGEAQQGKNGDDLLDIFRNEKEQKEKDIVHEILVDVDIHDLLEETRELMAEINTRRYGKR
jgi:hypothetical protein